MKEWTDDDWKPICAFSDRLVGQVFDAAFEECLHGISWVIDVEDAEDDFRLAEPGDATIFLSIRERAGEWVGGKHDGTKVAHGFLLNVLAARNVFEPSIVAGNIRFSTLDSEPVLEVCGSFEGVNVCLRFLTTLDDGEPIKIDYRGGIRYPEE